MSGGNWKEMFKAACDGDLALLRYHVESGADINYAHPEFLATPLVASILANQEQSALYLLAQGANPHLRSEFDGLTPAQAAHQAGLGAVADRLQAMGAVAPQPLPVNMLAWVCPAYGGPEVLTLCPRPVPKLAPHQLLVKVEATSVEISDVRIRSQHFPRGFGFIGRLVFGWRRARQPVLGSVLAGTVVAVGSKVQRWAVGQRIVAATGLRAGAHAESAALSEKSAIVGCPPALSAAQAVALVFGGLTAQFFLDRAALRPQEKVLVIGATGSVGNALVQMARARRAEVTALSSEPNLALARELGATHALDYRLHPPASLPEHGYDVVADTCAAASLVACLPILRAGGRYLNIAGDLPSMLTRARHGRRSISGTGREHAQDLQRLMDLATAGVLKPLVDSVWSFADLPAAHARAGSGHKRGCVVVQVSELGEAQVPVEVGKPVHEAPSAASVVRPA